MSKKNVFWFFSLCAFICIGCATSWSIPLRIAAGANAALVLLDVVVVLKRHIKNKEK